MLTVLYKKKKDIISIPLKVQINLLLIYNQLDFVKT